MAQTPTTPSERFKSLLDRLARVPKREIDQQEKKYRKEREAERTAPKRKRA
jgi:hypothetical protein